MGCPAGSLQITSSFLILVNLIFASHNAHKIQEVQEILGEDLVSIIGLKDMGFHDEIEETGDTLAENALIKARAVHGKTGQNVFSDDTGLEVYALDLAPGVHTARYAGESKDSDANMNKMLDALAGRQDRKARFRTVVALIYEGQEYLFEGIVDGNISVNRAGVKGFGYDPVFIPQGYDKTFAELDAEIKNSISHRFRAMQALRTFLQDLA